MIDELDDRRLPPRPPTELALVGADLGLAPRIRRGRWRDLDPVTLHQLARLRSEVLVVEAVRPYLDLDDADLADGTEHLWVADGEEPVAYLRVEHVGGPNGKSHVGRWRAGAVIPYAVHRFEQCVGVCPATVGIPVFQDSLTGFGKPIRDFFLPKVLEPAVVVESHDAG